MGRAVELGQNLLPAEVAEYLFEDSYNLGGSQWLDVLINFAFGLREMEQIYIGFKRQRTKVRFSISSSVADSFAPRLLRS